MRVFEENLGFIENYVFIPEYTLMTAQEDKEQSPNSCSAVNGDA